jgi:arylsulfatase
MRRLFVLILVVSTSAFDPVMASASGGSRPNIVVIMADDMGFSDLGCYGSEISTPTLDGLAAAGLRFRQFYNTTRCCPTRASLLTGLYPHQAGIGHMTSDDRLPGYRGFLNARCVTIAEALQPAGYKTLLVGKWHVMNYHFRTDTPAPREHWPRQRGFDRFFGTLTGAGSFYDPPSLTRENERIRPKSVDFYYTDAISDQAVKYVHEYGGENLFFMYVAYTAPHWPLHALPEDIARYKGRYDAGWDALRAERHKRMIEMGIVDERWPLTPRDKDAPAWADAEHKEWQARRMEVYAAQIDRMDQGIGRIVGALKAKDVLDNTLLMFLADNGGCAEDLPVNGWIRKGRLARETLDGRPMRDGNDPSIMPGPDDTFASYGLAWANASNTPFRRYKHWVHEGGIATPLIVHWPAVLKTVGRMTDEVGHVIDIMATCLDVAGATYPRRYNGNEIHPLEGRSLLPALRDEPMPDRGPIFWEHEGNRAVRLGQWKLVSKHPDQWELYDLEADRTELNDLATQQTEELDELISLYNDWAERSYVAPWKDLNDHRRYRTRH